MGKYKPTGNPMGRPRKVISQKQFESLCAIQCTIEEVCAVLDVDEALLERWCKETYDGKTFAKVFKEKRQMGRMSLRRSQFKLAEKNATMAIWLGKQYLDQRDKDIQEAAQASNGVLESILALRQQNDNMEQ